jgi:hypothetical protein
MHIIIMLYAVVTSYTNAALNGGDVFLHLPLSPLAHLSSTLKFHISYRVTSLN